MPRTEKEIREDYAAQQEAINADEASKTPTLSPVAANNLRAELSNRMHDELLAARYIWDMSAQLIPRDLEAELDELKQRLASIESTARPIV